jgi:hypothetical protein
MIGGVPKGNAPLWGLAVVLALGGIVELVRWRRRIAAERRRAGEPSSGIDAHGR